MMPETTDNWATKVAAAGFTDHNVVPIAPRWNQVDLPPPEEASPTSLVRVLCAGCRQPVGFVGVPHNGSYMVAVEFGCPCGATTAWRSA
jgi:hypothetical protein